MAKRTFVERLGPRSGGDKFDLEFWQKLGHEARFAAAWEMTAEVDFIRGNNAVESRLQRTVQNIQWRKR